MNLIDNEILSNSTKPLLVPKEPVAILLNRSRALFSLVNQCFINNVQYVLLDPTWPKDRILFLCYSLNPKTIYTSVEYANMFDCDNAVILDPDAIYQLANSLSSNDIAYINYTSGSTGTPKGVEITRASLFNFIEGISEIIDFTSKKRIACLTTVSFDIFFLESIVALYKGLTVVLANEEEQRNPKLMAKLIQDNAVDMIQMTPSRMQLLLNHDKELSCLKNVKEIMIGGETFPLSLLRTLQEKTVAKIYNMYAPTETTIWSTVSDVTHKDRIDIGRPIKNTEIYIVDESLSILSDGQAGEICIAGKGLAKGYVNQDDLTTEKFIYLPQKPDIRVYRTGDMGRYLPDGDLEYLGRTDNQVKIRGHRIELEEIETHINQFVGIKQSIVIALETGENDKVLEAFYTSDSRINSKDIIEYLSSKLPSYMIPVVFKHVENFIQTANGKIDRKRVLECIEIKPDTITLQNLASDLNAIQKKALSIIESNLEAKITDEISLDTDFTSIGVDSITFIKVIVALEVEFDFEFDDEMLLITKFPTIKTMVEYIESKVN